MVTSIITSYFLIGNLSLFLLSPIPKYPAQQYPNHKFLHVYYAME